MSKDIIVLAPNGRRQTVHCKPDTSILQVLEDVCLKQGFQPKEYNLKHHNHILDLTTTIRFSNLPNKATVEMVEAEKKREESNVTIGLQLEDGERRTADFSPNTSIYDLIVSLARNELETLEHPTILYMRQEIAEVDLKKKTLRHLGLIKGRAILRLLNKTGNHQANVSSVYRKSNPESSLLEENVQVVVDELIQDSGETQVPGPSDICKNEVTKNVDVLQLIKKEKKALRQPPESNRTEKSSPAKNQENKLKIGEPMEVDENNVKTKKSIPKESQEDFERRLKIEEEVTFLGENKAIVYAQPDELPDELLDLPDDFYDLTIDEVRKLYHELQQQRIDLENIPLVTSSQKESAQEELSQSKGNSYKNAVVRIQFPDRIILQGVFAPTDTIQDIYNFIKLHLQEPNKLFQIFTTPVKEMLEPMSTLLDARFVPCVHMHFKWMDNSGQPYLKDYIYSMKTSSDAASILASKYRAPSRRKQEERINSPRQGQSTSKNSQVPKWFK